MKKLIALSCLTALLLAGCGIDQPNDEISKPEPVSAATPATTTAPETEPTTKAVTTKKTKPATTKASTTTAAATTTIATTTNSSGGTATFTDRLDACPELYKAEVQRVWDKTYEENDGCVMIDYALYDIDHDSIPELIFNHGTCEADSIVDIYTVDLDAKLLRVSQLNGSHTVFARDDVSGDFVLSSGHMNEMALLWYTMDDDFKLNLHKEYVWRMDYISAYSFDKDSEIKSYLNYAYSEYEEVDGLYLEFYGNWNAFH